jgi:ornithine cyclodeaminase/alanine dehydrogenase-like protein (mu-crystallin family)
MKITSLSMGVGDIRSGQGVEQGESAGEEGSIQSKRSSATASRKSSSKSSTQSATSELSGLTLSPTPASTSELTSPASEGSTQASLTLLDSTGVPTGLINAAEVTAFRTALTALLAFNRRSNVETVTVFGAGKQAYWHIKLALLLRGSEIKHVNIINRSFERATNLLRDFYSPEHRSWRSDVKFSAVSPDFVEYDRLLKESVRKADVIFCCTASQEPLFPAKFLTSNEGRKKGRFVSAIGSFHAQMTELHPEILQDAVTEPQRHHHHHPTIHQRPQPRRGGVIVVDSLESCLREAGEVIQAGLKPQQLVEVGELMMVKEAAKQQIDTGGDGEKGLREWMEKGNVIYKSVGMGLMDLVVGRELVRLAAKRKLGTTIEDF